MSETNLPPPPLIEEDDIPTNQMNSEFGEYIPNEKSDDPGKEIGNSKLQEKNVTVNPEINPNEDPFVNTDKPNQKEYIIPNTNEENNINLNPTSNFKDEDSEDYEDSEDIIINNKEEKIINKDIDVIKIIDDIKIPQIKKNKCDFNCFKNCECCECCKYSYCDKYNYYKIHISFIIFLIQNIIYLI